MTAIAPENVNPLLLPSVALEQRSQLPVTPCIYFAIDSQGVVQYIGQSVNPRQRWSLHHRYEALKRIGQVRIAYIDCPKDLLEEIEKALIEWFRPVLNTLNIKPVRVSKGIRIRQVKEVEVQGLGEQIRQARLVSSKSLEQICDEVGVSRTYWYDIEKETLKGALSIENLRKIEKNLGINLGVRFDDYS